jgi:hypothetical protein
VSSGFSIKPPEKLNFVHLTIELVCDVFKVAPSLRTVFLASLGSEIHASAVRVLFSTLTLPDDARLFGTASPSVRSVIIPLMANPKRYAHEVKSLIICDPDLMSVSTRQTNGLLSGLSRGGTFSVDSSHTCQPLDANDVSRILELCNNLEGITWESPFPPPDGLCEVS